MSRFSSNSPVFSNQRWSVDSSSLHFSNVAFVQAFLQMLRGADSQGDPARYRIRTYRGAL
jgi:hypothetical protein